MKNLRKSARFKVSPHFIGLFGGLGAVVMVVGKRRDDAGAQFVSLRMAQFQRRHLFEMLVQQPGMIDQGLQDQRLAAGQGATLAAHDRAQRKLGTSRLIWTAIDGLAD